MDAGLAKIVNSTVGTDHFKPLDKLLYGRYGLVPSENTYFKVGNFETVTLEVPLTVNKELVEATAPVFSMKMWTEGGFSISGSVGLNISNAGSVSNYPKYDIKIGFAVYKNGVMVGTSSGWTGTGTLSDTIETTTTGTVENIYFSTGDIIEVRLYFYGKTTNIYPINVTCSVAPTSPFVIRADAVEKPFDITYAE